MDEGETMLAMVVGLPTADVPSDVEIAEPTAVVPVKKAKKAKGGDQVIAPDPISQAAQKIENLDAKGSAALALELIDGGEFNTFQLGGVFAVMNEKKFYLELGYPDFKTFSEQVHGIKYRKAMYLASIYQQVVELQLPWQEVSKIGWTKMKTILNPSLNLVTKDNVTEWVEKAGDMTVLQLEQLVSSKNDETKGIASEQDAGKTVSTMTFKLHTDQKERVRDALEKAKELSGTPHDNVALEMIALDFLGKPMPTQDAPTSTKKSKKADVSEMTAEGLTSLMQSQGYVAVLEAFDKAFPHIVFEVSIPEME